MVVNLVGGVDVSVTGLSVTATVGTGTSIIINAYAPPTGIAATGGVGSVTISEGAGIDVTPTGIAATGGVTEPTIIGTAPNVAVTGIAGTGTVGPVTVLTSQVVPLSSDNLIATGSVGTVTVETISKAEVTGVSTSALVGSVVVYETIVPAPGTSWSNVGPNPGSTWTEETPNPGTTWTTIGEAA